MQRRALVGRHLFGERLKRSHSPHCALVPAPAAAKASACAPFPPHSHRRPRRNEQEIDRAMAEMEELEEQLEDSIRWGPGWPAIPC